MDSNFDQTTQERAVLVGLNADCFTKEQTATEETLEELEALLETAGGFCTGKVPFLSARRRALVAAVRRRAATASLRRGLPAGRRARVRA